MKSQRWNVKVCFIGHRHIKKDESTISLLRQTIVDLINKGTTAFLFGSMSEFNKLSWEIVTALKEEYPHIKRVYVRAIYKYIDKNYEEFLLKSYEETYYPLKLEKAGKYSYVERNFEMIDNSAFCIFYYNENYVPISNTRQKHNMPLPSKRNSGTKIAYDYAKKKNKEIINIYRQSS